MDSEEHRLAFILEGQQHCDHFLTPIADPAGKGVLVAGSGAGTEMLWCIRHGAREVVGVDVAPQTADALTAACAQLRLEPVFSMHQMAIEDATKLERRFDLVLSNNVFEHVSDIARSLHACAELAEPEGRIAIFTDPLYYSSSGSHLSHRPWEHLWGDVAGLDEIPLNKMRVTDFLDAVRSSGLVLINLRIVQDRNLQSLPEYYDKLLPIGVSDLTIEGLAAEFVRMGNPDTVPTEQRMLAQERQRHESQVAELHTAIRGEQQHVAELEALLHREREAHEEERARLLAAAQQWMSTAAEVKSVLDGVEASLSFRIGRVVTGPVRWIVGRRSPVAGRRSESDRSRGE